MPALLLAALLFQAGTGDVTAEARRGRAAPEAIEAVSWLARGALAEGRLEEAERYAAQTRELVAEALRHRPLDADRHLPLALGASIEVAAQALAARGRRAEAVELLRGELKTWGGTSIAARLQKNLNLLTLEGQPGPPLEIKEWLGARPQTLETLRGRVTLLFFWAHWCGDCRTEAPVLERLEREYGTRGLAILGPTQRYGYAARGEETAPERELAYIEQVRRAVYGGLKDMPVPVSEENFRRYGASTTPTLVLLDRKGIVRMYHPGRMNYEELAARVEAALGPK